MDAARCLIVDDSAAFCAAARSMLERGGFEVVGTAGDADEAVRMTAQLRPDIALVDVDLGTDSGFDVARQLDGVRVILTSTHDEQDFADLIVASPALGFLPKLTLSPDRIRELIGR
ncbi:MULTISPECIES: response regulator [Mycobacteriaceae]|uniref:Chemotaxis protein CheY n=1 Tax=Mycolicibacterium neoaurum VKM Ac-1815D TaxID=700508 RepID=V5X915_MYCNE|nr:MULTISPECIES: response regulator transcription factor [Mycobacteriaceae]AHC24945.1 chemotaxis protein CheY [Mycolicibacterium neoaurum VKM Ac-1815D]AMO05479.1 chemotaxis protein CheY [Mycolicibacterium neoaurum]AXK76202.1 response regulator [Mycolicibacterium neoaurum]KJQ50677.1 chemotaxis protein CheY [Mycolicibacterium neoaurum]KUM09861.1 hypothetical protein AVZ31_03175 [Mycolicibacterium neoaurum]